MDSMTAPTNQHTTRLDRPTVIAGAPPVMPAAPSPELAPAPALTLPTTVASRVLGTDLLAVPLAVVVCAVGLWVRHGGVSALTKGWTLAWTSLTQVSGLLASLVGLGGLVLVARPKIIERRVGLDTVFIWHRYLGESMAILVGVHTFTGLASYSEHRGWFGAISDLTGREPYMAAATIGAALIGLVTISSLRSMRRQLSYETWYFVHLLAYAGFAISYGHEIVLGSDFSDDTIARWFWGLLHLAVLAALVWGRWGRLVLAWRRPLHVSSTQRLNNDTVVVHVDGPRLSSMQVDAGQFFMLRAKRRDLWWQAHPFSLSAAPTTAGLRFTIKDKGDASRSMTALAPGSAVVVEGPYGMGAADVFDGRKAVFVAGGVGIGPVRSMLERLDPTTEPVVLYRAHKAADLVHLDELEQLVASRNGIVRVLIGPTAALARKDPFGPGSLRAVMPDIAERSAVVCGPESLIYAASAGLKAAGIPSSRIHFERPWW